MRAMQHFAGIAAALASGLAPSSVAAQPPPVETPRRSWTDRLTPSVAVGLGATAFVNGAMRDVFSTGPTWSVRAALGRTREVRVEIAYVGSSQQITGDGIGASELRGHGAHAGLRINVGPTLPVEPTLFIAGGWTRFAVRGGATGPMLTRTDDVLEIPVGVGFAYRAGGFVFDTRFAFTIVSGADLLAQTDPTTSQPGETMHHVGLTLSAGYEL